MVDRHSRSASASVTGLRATVTKERGTRVLGRALVLASTLSFLLGPSSLPGAPAAATESRSLARAATEAVPRLLHGAARGLGLVRGDFDERRRLARMLEEFVEGEGPAFIGRPPRERFEDRVLDEVRVAIGAIALAQRGYDDLALEVLRESAVPSTFPELLSDVLAVSLERRASWEAVRASCAGREPEKRPHLLDPAEIRYHCAMIAARADFWEEAARLSALLEPDGDYAPYAWYAAGVSAARAGQAEVAQAMLERAARNVSEMMTYRSSAASRRTELFFFPHERLRLQSRARAALVAVHARNGDSRRAMREMSRISPADASYPLALEAIAGEGSFEPSDVPDLFSGPAAPTVLAVRGDALERTGNHAGAIAAFEQAARELRRPFAEPKDGARRAWIDAVTTLEREHLAFERLWRGAVAARAWPVVGAFFTAEPENVRRSDDPPPLAVGHDGLPPLDDYLRMEERRIGLRRCLASASKVEECEASVEQAYEDLRAEAIARRREELYGIERRLADALLFTSVRAAQMRPRRGDEP